MKKKADIRLGIIGMSVNNMASTLTLLEKEAGLRFRVRAVCGRRREVVERSAREFNIPFQTTDHRELVARDDVDVVCVFSPDHLHAEHCVAALEAGKHVVCTKPMVTRLEDARRLVGLVRRHKRKFLVGQTMRFDRQFLVAKKLLQDGDLGDLLAVE
ncbi:MAG: Gfo/Idh/MocA family oxidoreductase, partial [Lentisphaerae bacterium]|nr:Gfo/Idh/MocA family oxidoreductase [Lentisphaerota bacterium]